MLRFARTCDAVAATTKKLEKLALVAGYLRSLDEDTAALATIFLCGAPFPRCEERTLAVGGRLLWEAVQSLSGADDAAMAAAYRRHGDGGSAIGDLLATRPSAGLTLDDLARTFDALSRARTQEQKLGLLMQLFAALSGPEAKYAAKIVTGDMRIGLKESLVEEAIARAWERPLAAVQRANMLTGDIGLVARLAARDRLHEAALRLSTPLGSMLASPAESPEDAMEYFPQGALVEDKFDGIRAQAHKQGSRVRLYSRTLDEITEFPELLPALAALPGDFILDGEILAWDYNTSPSPNAATVTNNLAAMETKSQREAPTALPKADAEPAALWRAEHLSVPLDAQSALYTLGPGRPLPFTTLQQRLGRKQLDLWTARRIPVRFVAFDLLYYVAPSAIVQQESGSATPSTLGQDPDRISPQKKHQPAVVRRAQRHSDGPLLLDSPLSERRQQLEFLLASADSASSAVSVAPATRCATAAELRALFNQALARGNEGLVVKDPASPYTPGRRGKGWLKLKRPMATLDVVVVAVEYGHGKRHAVLSDYTFAVRDGERLAIIGKAYSGLTDPEIASLTQWFLAHSPLATNHSPLRPDPQVQNPAATFGAIPVAPSIVIEVAFNNIQRSSRHPSGFALRFPRILRLRPDKPVTEIDTLARVAQLFAQQHATSHNKP